MEETALEVDIDRKNIGRFQLRDIHFVLKKGYILGVTGRMGAGKTSLMKYILNPGKPGKQNRIWYGGNAGAIMEGMPFLETASLNENAGIYGILYEDYSEELFREYLQRVDLGGHMIYGHLSKGEKIKFQYAFAMSHNPTLLILDEPDSGLDVTFRREFWYLLQEAVEKKMISVIISSHHTEELEKIADYIGYMEDGTFSVTGDGNELPGTGKKEQQECETVSLKRLKRFDYEMSRTNLVRFGGYIAWFLLFLFAMVSAFANDREMYGFIAGMSAFVVGWFLVGALVGEADEGRIYFLPVRKYFPIKRKDYVLSKCMYLFRYVCATAAIAVLPILAGWLLRL